MERFLFMFCMVIAIAQGNQVPSPIEAYWHSVLPNTSMPNSIRELVYPEHKSKRVKQLCIALYIHTLVNEPIHVPAAGIRANFLQKKSIFPGAKLKDVHLIKRTIIGNACVRRSEADAILFSSKNLPQVLEHFSTAPNSEEAKLIEKTLKGCEAPPLKGEKKFCSTSLESMIDNVIYVLGTNDIEAISTTINGSLYKETIYKVVSPIQKLSEHGKLVICYPQASPQAIHYCHTSVWYSAYSVPLVGDNGSTVNAVIVCHYDVSNFNPFILEALKVKSDIESICHFLQGDHIVWVPNYLKDSN